MYHSRVLFAGNVFECLGLHLHCDRDKIEAAPAAQVRCENLPLVEKMIAQRNFLQHISRRKHTKSLMVKSVPKTQLRLPRAGLFRHAPVQMLEVMETLAIQMKLEAHAVLFRQGDEGDTLFALEDGTLEVSVISLEGRKLALDVIQPGNLIGEIALFDPGARTATVTALEPCTLLSISRTDLIPAILANPQLGLDITAAAAKRMRLLTDQLHQQAFLRLPERLARKILHLTSQQTSVTQLAISQEELGSGCIDFRHGA